MTRPIWGPTLMRLVFHDSIFMWRLLCLPSSLQRNKKKKAIYSCPYCFWAIVLSTPVTFQSSLRLSCAPEWTLCSGQSRLNLRAGLGFLSWETLPVTTCHNPPVPPKPPWCHFPSSTFPDATSLFLPLSPHISPCDIELILPYIIISCVLVFPRLSILEMKAHLQPGGLSGTCPKSSSFSPVCIDWTPSPSPRHALQFVTPNGSKSSWKKMSEWIGCRKGK